MPDRLFFSLPSLRTGRNSGVRVAMYVVVSLGLLCTRLCTRLCPQK